MSPNFHVPEFSDFTDLPIIVLSGQQDTTATIEVEMEHYLRLLMQLLF